MVGNDPRIEVTMNPNLKIKVLLKAQALYVSEHL